MFTGIVKDLGLVRSFGRARNLYNLAVESKIIYKGVNIGDSVSVNGVCLTVVRKDKGIISFDITEETVRRSNLSGLKNAGYVNLEDPLKADGQLSGHFVLGHIDCVARIRDINNRGEGSVMEIEIPEGFRHLIVEKGSVAIDGVSLTVGEVGGDRFKVYLIPHTLVTTTLGLRKTGDGVNIEFDIIGKYISRSNDAGRSSNITEGFLKEKGFLG